MTEIEIKLLKVANQMLKNMEDCKKLETSKLKLKMIEQYMDSENGDFREYCDKMFGKKGMEKMKYNVYKEIFELGLQKLA